MSTPANDYTVWFEIQPDGKTVFPVGVTNDDGDTWTPREAHDLVQKASAEVGPSYIVSENTPTGSGELLEVCMVGA